MAAERPLNNPPSPEKQPKPISAERIVATSYVLDALASAKMEPAFAARQMLESLSGKGSAQMVEALVQIVSHRFKGSFNKNDPRIDREKLVQEMKDYLKEISLLGEDHNI